MIILIIAAVIYGLFIVANCWKNNPEGLPDIHKDKRFIKMIKEKQKELNKEIYDDLVADYGENCIKKAIKAEIEK